MIKDRTPLHLEGNILITGLTTKQYFPLAVFFFYQRYYLTFEPKMTTQSANVMKKFFRVLPFIRRVELYGIASVQSIG